MFMMLYMGAGIGPEAIVASVDSYGNGDGMMQYSEFEAYLKDEENNICSMLGQMPDGPP